jgi:hypothetical protein
MWVCEGIAEGHAKGLALGLAQDLARSFTGLLDGFEDCDCIVGHLNEHYEE